MRGARPSVIAACPPSGPPRVIAALAGRRLGCSAVVLPAITLGTMRLANRGADVGSVSRLFAHAAELGVDTLHTSREYKSFPLVVEAARRLRGRAMRHVVKLADPHFGESRFDTRRFLRRFDDYLRLLETDRIEVVQWMCRAYADDLPRRRLAMRSALDGLPEAVRSLHEAGKLGALVAFPYRGEDVDDLLPYSWCDGFALYLNAAELDYVPRLDGIATQGRGVLALRPFHGGALLAAPGDIEAHLRLALSHPAVASAIVSTSSTDHLSQLVEGAARMRADRAKFGRRVAQCEATR